MDLFSADWSRTRHVLVYPIDQHSRNMLHFILKAVSSGRFLAVSETCPARHISLLLTSATNLKTTFILFYFSPRHEMR